MFIPTASYGKKWVLLTGGLAGIPVGIGSEELSVFPFLLIGKRWGNRTVYNAVRQFVRETATGDASVAINNAAIATISEILREMAATSSDGPGLHRVAATVASRWLRLPQTAWTQQEISDYFLLNMDRNAFAPPSERRIWLAVIAYLCRSNSNGYLICPTLMNTLADRLAREFSVRMARRLTDIPQEEGAIPYFRTANQLMTSVRPKEERNLCRPWRFAHPTVIAFTLTQIAQDFLEIFGGTAVLA